MGLVEFSEGSNFGMILEGVEGSESVVKTIKSQHRLSTRYANFSFSSPKDMNSLRFLSLCVLSTMSPGWRRQPIITMTYGSIIER